MERKQKGPKDPLRRHFATEKKCLPPSLPGMTPDRQQPVRDRPIQDQGKSERPARGDPNQDSSRRGKILMTAQYFIPNSLDGKPRSERKKKLCSQRSRHVGVVDRSLLSKFQTPRRITDLSTGQEKDRKGQKRTCQKKLLFRTIFQRAHESHRRGEEGLVRPKKNAR